MNENIKRRTPKYVTYVHFSYIVAFFLEDLFLPPPPPPPPPGPVDILCVIVLLLFLSLSFLFSSEVTLSPMLLNLRTLSLSSFSMSVVDREVEAYPFYA